MIERVAPKKTRRGWLGQLVKQTYPRDDIHCGILQCAEHKTGPFEIDMDATLDLYFPDEETLLNQTDILENCQELGNLVIIQSLVEQLKLKKPAAFTHFKHFLDGHSSRVYVFPNEYHAQCIIPQRNENRQLRTAKALIQSVKWFANHVAQEALRVRVNILTSDYAMHKLAKEQNLVSISLIDFLKQHDSNMLDYVGFGETKSKTLEKQVFAEHIDERILLAGLKKGTYIEGKYMEARSYIKIAGEMIPCQLDNNRAMYGDTIAVLLHHDNKWKKNLFVLTDDEEPEEVPASVVEVERDNSDLLKRLKETTLIPTGTIVGIVKRQPRSYCGSITNDSVEKLESGDEIREFVPVDPRFPSFYIKTFNSHNLLNKRIVVTFDGWPANSAKPLGHFKRIIGDIGDMRTEGDVILLEHNVEIAPFSKAVYECLPPEGDAFAISAEEIKKRLDLRSINVVSIDPPGCKDIDDALHCYPLPNGNYSVGVHIADVSHFVRPDTAIDREAAHRSTTVYLVDRRTDMLPKLLTENLCSLRADVERLVFSTIWEMDAQANIIKTEYCKSVIRSRSAMTYYEAQSRIDNPQDQSDITKSIRMLNVLAKKLKQNRLDKGALQLASTQVKFSFDQQTHNPTDVQLYNLLETNSLIEEFMLLSNCAVAEKIVERFPSVSVLRHHVPPKFRQLEDFKKLLSTQGFSFEMTTSKELADSLDRLQRPNDDFFNKLMRIMTTRCMNEATYFCSADYDLQEFYHYGLAAPLYTHFTSPIRRYADVLVHRLLAAAIDLEALPHYMSTMAVDLGNKLKMARICDKMNMRHRMARFASRASSDYHTYLFFKDRKLKEQAIVTTIGQEGFTVMLPKYGLESTIKFSPEDRARNDELNKNESILQTFFSNGRQRRIFDYLTVAVEVELKGFHKRILLQEVTV